MLVKLKAGDKGWDGFFDGKKMPGDDYWFRVEPENAQEFNGHFTLVR